MHFHAHGIDVRNTFGNDCMNITHNDVFIHIYPNLSFIGHIQQA